MIVLLTGVIGVAVGRDLIIVGEGLRVLVGLLLLLLPFPILLFIGEPLLLISVLLLVEVVLFLRGKPIKNDLASVILCFSCCKRDIWRFSSLASS